MNITNEGIVMDATKKLEELKAKQSTITDFDEKMELMDEILKLEKSLGLIPDSSVSQFECFGCGS